MRAGDVVSETTTSGSACRAKADLLGSEPEPKKTKTNPKIKLKLRLNTTTKGTSIFFFFVLFFSLSRLLFSIPLALLPASKSLPRAAHAEERPAERHPIYQVVGFLEKIEVFTAAPSVRVVFS